MTEGAGNIVVWVLGEREEHDLGGGHEHMGEAHEGGVWGGEGGDEGVLGGSDQRAGVQRTL